MKYYSRRLVRIERWNFGIEVFLALSASSAIAGMFLTSGWGKTVWGAVGALSSILLVIKPILNLPKRIREYETVLTGYRALHNDLAEIKVMITQKGAYDAAIQAEFRRARKRHALLVTKSPETTENAVLKKKCEDEVLKEYPVDSFFVPPQLKQKVKEKVS
jgi:hypothetical protein